MVDIGSYSGYMPYIGAGAVILAGSLLFLNSYNIKKRRQAFQRLGDKYGFTYEETFDTSLLPEFDVFRIGDKKEAKNVLTGSYNLISWKIFDYIVTEKKGEKKEVHENTVFMVQLYNVNLPSFKLSPKGFMQRMGFGGKEIEIDSKAFRERFTLQGIDEIRIRDMFRPDVIKFLEGLARSPSLEGYGNMIVYHEKGKTKELDDAFNRLYEFALFFTREYKILEKL